MKWNELQDGDLLVWQGVVSKESQIILIALFNDSVYYRRVWPTTGNRWDEISAAHLDIVGWQRVGNVDTLFQNAIKWEEM